MKVGDRDLEPEVQEQPDGALRVRLDGTWRAVSLRRLGVSPRYVLTVDGRPLDVLVRETRGGFEVYIQGTTYNVEQGRRGQRRPSADDSDRLVDGKWQLHSALTGAVIDVRVKLGDTVQGGDVLLVVEAMKMQNELRARIAGKVTAVNASVGQRVETGSLLVEITANQQAPPSNGGR